MQNKQTIQAAIAQLKTGEALRREALETLEQQLLQANPKKKALSEEHKQKILARFFKNHITQ